MRFSEKGKNPALEKVKTIVDAAKDAGVNRLIYISHTQASTQSSIEYIRAKALAEEYIKSNMDSYGFIRPCAIFGDTANESLLINNIAYIARKLPLLLVPGNSDMTYFQPVHVRDLAEMAVNLAFSEKNTFVDAVGPEKFL